MAGPIYKLWMMRPKEAYYQLPEEERNSLGATVQDALRKVGGKSIVTCTSGWSNEQWMLFGVEEFPDVEAVQRLSELHNELDWFRYAESFSMLGVEWPPS
jgi:hypothetical protein